MSAYQTFTSARPTEPDMVALLTTLRTQDTSAGIQHDPGSAAYVVKKQDAWTQPQIAFVQNAIDTAPAITLERRAQNEIDLWPIATRALVLALIDQLNVIRAALPSPLAPISPAQALAAIRTKAGTL